VNNGYRLTVQVRISHVVADHTVEPFPGAI